MKFILKLFLMFQLELEKKVEEKDDLLFDLKVLFRDVVVVSSE